MRNSNDKLRSLSQTLNESILKQSLTEHQLNQLLLQCQLLELSANTILFTQCDMIKQYYFLIKGTVSLYRTHNAHRIQKMENRVEGLLEGELVEVVQAVKCVGEFFIGDNSVRDCSAVVMADSVVVKVDKKGFFAVCQSFTRLYMDVDQYARKSLKVGKKTDTFEVFSVKSYRLGSCIKLKQQLGVILGGQCKVILVDYCRQHPQTQTKGMLPPISPPKARIKDKQLALLSQNEWVCTQNIEPENSKIFKYIVTSQNLSLLTFSISQINMLPQQKIQMITNVHHQRLDRIFYQERASTRTRNEQSSISPKALKQRAGQAQRILQKIDSNISPNATTQQDTKVTQAEYKEKKETQYCSECRHYIKNTQKGSKKDTLKFKIGVSMQKFRNEANVL